MPSTRLGRRQFAKWSTTLAVGFAAPPVQAQEPTASQPSELDLLMEIARQRWGSRLAEEHLKEVREDLAGQLSRSARLSAFPLSNGDEPRPVFAAYRADG